MFSAFEGAIMVSAIHSYFTAIPLSLLYLVVGLGVIPLTWYGLTVMNYIMWVTIPIYIVFMTWPYY